MRSIVIIVLFGVIVFGAAPDDIAPSSQRAWYDAVDIDADGDYTDNPSNNALIARWKDKSGNGKDVAINGTNIRPHYLVNQYGGRNGVYFDGGDILIHYSNDIWTGGVQHSEIFVMATTDQRRKSFVFASMKKNNERMRLSSHIPWVNNHTYFDHGYCCVGRARLSGYVSIVLTRRYFWHYIADWHTEQAVVRDGKKVLHDNNGVDTYQTYGTNSYFALAGNPNGTTKHKGKIYEAIFYQTTLNDAQRRIMSAYLSAKWDKPFASSANFPDVYSGDDAGHGEYDFFVGGIGKESNGAQSTGTSQGLTIRDHTFLSANGKYIVAGVDYLTTTPPTGTIANDIPATYEYRAKRVWYIDVTGSGGDAFFDFAAAAIGIPTLNGREYGLLCYSATTGTFQEVATTLMQNGVATFTALPNDGVCTIGLKRLDINMTKSSCVIDDPVNNTANPKRIPGATIRYAIEVYNQANIAIDNVIAEDNLTQAFDSSTIANLRIGNSDCNCSNPGATSSNGSNGTGNGVNPVKLDFGTLSNHSKKCGYFEVKIR